MHIVSNIDNLQTQRWITGSTWRYQTIRFPAGSYSYTDTTQSITCQLQYYTHLKLTKWPPQQQKADAATGVLKALRLNACTDH